MQKEPKPPLELYDLVGPGSIRFRSVQDAAIKIKLLFKSLSIRNIPVCQLLNSGHIVEVLTGEEDRRNLIEIQLDHKKDGYTFVSFRNVGPKIMTKLDPVWLEIDEWDDVAPRT